MIVGIGSALGTADGAGFAAWLDDFAAPAEPSVGVGSVLAAAADTGWVNGMGAAGTGAPEPAATDLLAQPEPTMTTSAQQTVTPLTTTKTPDCRRRLPGEANDYRCRDLRAACAVGPGTRWSRTSTATTSIVHSFSRKMW